MTLAERHHYVRWWIERSGLTRNQIRQLAAGVWPDSSVETPGRVRAVSKHGLVIRVAAYGLTHSSDS